MLYIKAGMLDAKGKETKELEKKELSDPDREILLWLLAASLHIFYTNSIITVSF